MYGCKRVENIDHPGYTIKLRQAEKAVEDCRLAWVEYGETVRDLTLAESIHMRIEDARRREPLPFAEIPGIKFELPANAGAVGAELALAYEAGKFAATQQMEAA